MKRREGDDRVILQTELERKEFIREIIKADWGKGKK